MPCEALSVRLPRTADNDFIHAPDNLARPSASNDVARVPLEISIGRQAAGRRIDAYLQDAQRRRRSWWVLWTESKAQAPVHERHVNHPAWALFRIELRGHLRYASCCCPPSLLESLWRKGVAIQQQALVLWSVQANTALAGHINRS